MIRINYDRRTRFTLNDVVIKLVNNKLCLMYDMNTLISEARYRPLSVTANGPELVYLTNRITNIPNVFDPELPEDQRVVVWHGEFAKFIVYNLRIDWDRPFRSGE